MLRETGVSTDSNEKLQLDHGWLKIQATKQSFACLLAFSPFLLLSFWVGAQICSYPGGSAAQECDWAVFFLPPSCCRWSKTEGWFDSPSRNNILQLWNRPSLLSLPEPGYRKPAVSSRDRPFVSTSLGDKSVWQLMGSGFLRSARRWGWLSSCTGYNCYRRCGASDPRPSGSTRYSMCPWGHPASWQGKGIVLSGSLTACSRWMILGRSHWACVYGKNTQFGCAGLIQLLQSPRSDVPRKGALTACKTLLYDTLI